MVVVCSPHGRRRRSSFAIALDGTPATALFVAWTHLLVEVYVRTVAISNHNHCADIGVSGVGGQFLGVVLLGGGGRALCECDVLSMH